MSEQVELARSIHWTNFRLCRRHVRRLSKVDRAKYYQIARAGMLGVLMAAMNAPKPPFVKEGPVNG